MLATLNIVIGLIFVLMLFSLLTSTVMDVISAVLSLKAKNMHYTLENMLGDKLDDFLKHPLFRQISYATTRRAKHSPYYLPGSVEKNTFVAILHDLMDAGNAEGLMQKVDKLEDGDLKRMMQFMLRQSGTDMTKFKSQVEDWYDQVMVRSNDWYKRTMKWWVFGVGLVLAAVLNADTIQIYKNISANPQTQQFLLELASKYKPTTDSAAISGQNLSVEQAIGRVDSVLQKIDEIRTPLGLGWVSEESDKNLPWWLIKLTGLLLTAIAVTFGAPFWYDLLKKLLPMSGKSDKTQEKATPTVIQLAPAPAPEPEVKPEEAVEPMAEVEPAPVAPPDAGTKKPVG